MPPEEKLLGGLGGRGVTGKAAADGCDGCGDAGAHDVTRPGFLEQGLSRWKRGPRQTRGSRQKQTSGGETGEQESRLVTVTEIVTLCPVVAGETITFASESRIR